jgi:hypothetical protein
MWNSFIASFIFDHDSIASLLRKLNRNSQLRIICGFQPHIYSVLTDKKDEYGKRTSIERINGRIDRDFKFEKHTIRGLRKMKMFLTVTFIIRLALAKSKIDSGITKGLARHIA